MKCKSERFITLIGQTIILNMRVDIDGLAISLRLPMAWVRYQLSAGNMLDAFSQRGGFTCLMARLSSALKPSSREYEYYAMRHVKHPVR